MKRMILVMPLVLLTGCPPPYYAWLEGTPTPSDLEFGLGTNEGGGKPLQLWVFLFTTCEESKRTYGDVGSASPERLENTLWYAAVESGDSIDREVLSARDPEGEYMYVQHVRLGVPPLGFVAPKELDLPIPPGCYMAEGYASGTALLGVEIREDGSVRPFEYKGAETVWPDGGDS